MMIIYASDPRDRPELQSASAFAAWVHQWCGGAGPGELAILTGRYLWRSRPSQTGVESGSV